MGSGRIPPDKLHERNVNSSNATLNTLFGSARQKSWMVGGVTPVRPTPRSFELKTTTSQTSTSGITNHPKITSPDKPASRASAARTVGKVTRRDAAKQDTSSIKNKPNSHALNNTGFHTSSALCPVNEPCQSSNCSQPETHTFPSAKTGILSPELDLPNDTNTICPADKTLQSLNSLNSEFSTAQATEAQASAPKLAMQNERNIDYLRNNLTQALSRSSSEALSPLLPGARDPKSPIDTQIDENVHCSIDESFRVESLQSEVPTSVSDQSQVTVPLKGVYINGNVCCSADESNRTRPSLPEIFVTTATGPEAIKSPVGPPNENTRHSINESSRTRPPLSEALIPMSAEPDITISQRMQSSRNTLHRTNELFQVQPSRPEIPVTKTTEPRAIMSQIVTQSDGNVCFSADESSKTKPSRSEVPVPISVESYGPISQTGMYSDKNLLCSTDKSIRTRPMSKTSLATTTVPEAIVSPIDLQGNGNVHNTIDESFRTRSSLPETPITATAVPEVAISQIDTQNDSNVTCSVDKLFSPPNFTQSEVPMTRIAGPEASVFRSDVLPQKNLPCSLNELSQTPISAGQQHSATHLNKSDAPTMRFAQDQSHSTCPLSEPPRSTRYTNPEVPTLMIPKPGSTSFASEDRSRENIEISPYGAQSLLVENSTTDQTQLLNNINLCSPPGTSTGGSDNSNALHQNETRREEQSSMTGTSRVLASSSTSPWITSEASSPTFQMQQASSIPRGMESNKSHSPSPSQYISRASLKSGLIMIEAQLKLVGGIESLNTGLERPRFQLMMEACNHEDLFYVTLHQLFVVWDLRRQEVISLPGVPDTKILQSGFTIIAKLIHSNEQLAPNHKRWFANFPAPLTNYWQFSDYRKKAVFEVFICLEKLSNNWLNCIHECKSRGFPLLVDEMTSKLGIFSPILQGVLFTATRRNMGIRDEKISQEMDQIFKKDQAEYQIIASRLGSANPPTIIELRSRNSALIFQYQTIFTRYQQCFSGTNSNQSGRAHQSQTSPPNQNLSRVPSPMIASQAQTHVQNSWVSALPTSNTWVTPNISQSTPRLTQQSFTSMASKNRTSANTASNPTQQNYMPLHRLSLNSPEQSTNPLSLDYRNSSMSIPINQPRQRPLSGVSTSGNFVHQKGTRSARSHAVTRPVSQQISQPLPQPISQHQVSTVPHWQNTMLPRQSQSSQHLNQLQHQQLQVQAHQAQLQRQQQMISQHHHLVNLQTVSRNPLLAPTQRMNNPIEVSQSVARNVNVNNNSVGVPSNSRSRNSSVSSNRPQTSGNNPFFTPVNYLGSTQVPPIQKYISNKVKDDIQLYHQTPIFNRSIVPPLNWVHPPNMLGTNQPELNALHQALLRSPQLVATVSRNTDKSEKMHPNRYYQVVRGFALSPSVIPNSAISKFEFGISENDICCIPVDTFSKNGTIPIRKFGPGSLQFRLRCVQSNKSEINISVHEWMVKSTTWPEGACLDINKNQLEIRRKAHYGKDLPIDITQNVLLNGTMSPNLVTFSVCRDRKFFLESNYLLAVEIVEILEHYQILDFCQRLNRLPISHTLDKIKKSLASPANDDFEMTISEISINLADPFTSCIFEIPVRGSSCLHRECFDLETFLLTRISKPNRPTQPCMVDVWKCPLCGRDARPCELQIDEYLESVRKLLADQGNLNAVKSIRVKPDGSWHPKVEKRKETSDNQESEDSSDNEFPISRKVKQSKSIEVISLDDD